MIALEIVTPDRRVLTAEVDEVVLPSVDGSMGVLPGHAPLLCQLEVGEMSYRQGDKRHYLAVSGGFAEVLRHKVSILARTTESSTDIDLERAQRAKARAEQELKVDLSESAFREAEIRLRRALCRIDVHSRNGI